MNEQQLLLIVNEIRSNANLPPVPAMQKDMELRKDLGLDSLGLATLTVRIEDQTGVDVFEDGLVRTVGEILAKLN